MESAAPHRDLLLNEETKVGGGEVTKVEDLQGRVRLPARRVTFRLSVTDAGWKRGHG
jgi:hypothetical protein